MSVHKLAGKPAPHKLLINIPRLISAYYTNKPDTGNQFHKLMRYFVRTRHYRVTNGGITLWQKYYIRQLKERLQWDDSHFQNYIYKYFHKRELNTYTMHDASNLIVALLSILKSSPDKRRVSHKDAKNAKGNIQ